MTNIVKDGMVVDPSIQKIITERAVAAKVGDQPDQAVHSLQFVTLPDGSQVNVWIRHAVDAIVIDSEGNTVVILRAHNPGAGKFATPGGFIDPLQGKTGAEIAEGAVAAALRELSEETGLSDKLLDKAIVTPLGGRVSDRPFDIRQAWGDMPGTPIKKGDFFIVSTQGFRVEIPVRLKTLTLKAGDDAKGFQVVNVLNLKPEQFGIQDHYPMIKRAVEIAPLPSGPIRARELT